MGEYGGIMEGVWRKHGGLEWESMEGVWMEDEGRTKGARGAAASSRDELARRSILSVKR